MGLSGPAQQERRDVSEALNEWNDNPDPETLRFHQRQSEPYRSTVHFAGFIRDWAEISSNIVDVGCGAGEPTQYLSEQFPNAHFVGIDSSKVLVEQANEKFGPKFVQADVCKLNPHWNADGVVSLALLSWMPDYQVPLFEICEKIRPRWIALSSLFYPGEISARIIVDEPLRPRKSYYNVYSIIQVERFMEEQGYKLKKKQPFIIDRDLPRPHDLDVMKTYTHKGMMFSGPLHLPWWFLGFER